MASKVKASSIAVFSVAILGLAALAFLVAYRPPAKLEVVAPPNCAPLPPNIEKLGPVLAYKDGMAALAGYGEQQAALKAQIRPGDVVRSFETGVTGGHLVMRGNCVIGQAVAWIR
ncbi:MULTISPECIES: hypothetical protein [unclassified Pseudoxanthomonas]|uniref:hypothetical protein n=1 Tax=unclassified Pseudoxanthomonas TaxID=2645906 RepID=UPI0011139BF4|nr:MULTISPECIES: hypothetical protein [unclassified Pseudoxanthomonas]